MDRDTSQASMARHCGLMYLSGAALSVVGIALPHSAKADIPAFWVIAAVAALVAAIALGLGERLPPAALQAAMLLASCLVGLSVYFNGERAGGHAAGNEVLFLWVALYSGFYFKGRALVMQLAGIGIVQAAALVAVHPGEVGFTRWLITIGMASLAGVVVHRLRRRNDDLVEQLVQAGRTDQLTGLLNRRGFQEQLDRELARCERSGVEVALVMADLDNFKELNDARGHLAGDHALAAVGDAARELVRRGDSFARLGGDEFAAILPETGAEAALRFAERMRDHVSRLAVEGAPRLGMSFGVAVYPTQHRSQLRLIEAADGALYAAKHGGGNRSRLSGPPLVHAR